MGTGTNLYYYDYRRILRPRIGNRDCVGSILNPTKWDERKHLYEIEPDFCLCGSGGVFHWMEETQKKAVLPHPFF
jgi:hypothetical protein